MKLARALNPRATHRDTLVMRSSLGGDEDQGAEVATVVRDRWRRARCVPDRPVKAGDSRSLPDSRHTGSSGYGLADPLRKPTFQAGDPIPSPATTPVFLWLGGDQLVYTQPARSPAAPMAMLRGAAVVTRMKS